LEVGGLTSAKAAAIVMLSRLIDATILAAAPKTANKD
jgi:hypothetical protein